MQNQPKLFSDGREIIDYGRNMFGMDAKHWAALQAIHGAVHQARIGVKYTWFGPGYISNVLFKMIANKPMYKWPNTGGDLAFMSCSGSSDDEEDNDDEGTGGASNVHSVAIGDKDGKPLPLTGWRASCMYIWNTDEGGPCFLRPTSDSFDAPNPDKIVSSECIKKGKA